MQLFRNRENMKLQKSILAAASSALVASTLFICNFGCMGIDGQIQETEFTQQALVIDTVAGLQGPFVKGINLNGAAVTVDGNAWLSQAVAKSSGFSTTAAKTYSNNITWSPAADAATSAMLNKVIYQANSSFTMSQIIGNGTYDVYFWLTENYSNNARKVDIKLEGTAVASGVGEMNKNTWVKYGPYTVTVSDGVLNMELVRIKGDPQCAGLAIFSKDLNETYGVTYDGNGNTGGTVPVDGNRYHAGDVAEIIWPSPSLVRTDYWMSGLNTKADGTGTIYSGSTSFTVNGNVTLYVQWRPVAGPYRVTYEGNGNTGGTVPVDGNFYLTGSSVTVLDKGSLVKSIPSSGNGYRFGSWIGYPVGRVYPGDRFIITEDINFIAQWESYLLARLQIVISDNEGSYIKSPDKEYYEPGEVVTITAIPKPGYVFKNFAGSVNSTENPTTITLDDISNGVFIYFEPQGSFVKGINLNGAAVTVDGNAWLSQAAAKSSGFSTTAAKTYSNNITWSPAADAATSAMLNKVIYQANSSFTMSQIIGNGTYDVYFWLTENYSNNARKVNIKLEGTVVASGVGEMNKNTWVKYGPYTVTVSDGVLNMELVRIKGDPQCAGLAILSNRPNP